MIDQVDAAEASAAQLEALRGRKERRVDTSCPVRLDRAQRAQVT